jgi:hypothetical protein
VGMAKRTSWHRRHLPEASWAPPDCHLYFALRDIRTIPGMTRAGWYFCVITI